MAKTSKVLWRDKTVRAWVLYDWANSAFITIVVTALFPGYFKKIANAQDILENPTIATERLALTTTIALSLVAIAAPFLGAIADAFPVKKKLLAAFMFLGVFSTGAMVFLGPNQWQLAAVLFALGNIGAMGSFVFYDALLPHIANHEQVDRVSAAGYALGYVGGGVCLFIGIQLFEHPEWLGLKDAESALRATFVLAAAWWLLFSIPLFRRVPEPPVLQTRSKRPALRTGASQLRSTFRELRRYREALIFLVAFLLYNDGVGTIIRFAVAYGEDLQLGTAAMIKAILLVQFVGIPSTFAFGALAGRLGTKTVIYLGLVVYSAVSVLGFFMTTATHFFALAILVGLVQGAVQSLSRSLFATLIPKDKSAEFFGLFAVFEKFAGIFGPLLFTLVIGITGSSRYAILAIISFFVLGALLLCRVDVAKGRQEALLQG